MVEILLHLFIIKDCALSKYLGCKNNILIPNIAIIIEKSAFAYCESIRKIKILGNVITIGKY